MKITIYTKVHLPFVILIRLSQEDTCVYRKNLFKPFTQLKIHYHTLNNWLPTHACRTRANFSANCVDFHLRIEENNALYLAQGFLSHCIHSGYWKWTYMYRCCFCASVWSLALITVGNLAKTIDLVFLQRCIPTSPNKLELEMQDKSVLLE